MAQIDIDKFVISLMRYFGNNKGIATTLDRCLFSLGLKYVDTPTGGRLERVDQPTLLEKIIWESGEQKTVDKVEPKFKVGEWIINAQGTLRHIINVDKGGYQTNGGWLTHDTYEKTFHLWTIQDAKDGDVVADKSDGAIGIFQSIGHHPDGGSYNDPSYCFLHCRYDDGFFYADFEDGNTIDSDYLVPATKEQRDLLFQKMKEAGYEWDAELKQLKKIEQKPWSEEDEKDFNTAIQHIENYVNNTPSSQRPEIWADIIKLKSLRPQKQWKPSATDIMVLEGVIDRDINPINYHATLHGILEQLKKLREE